MKENAIKGLLQATTNAFYSLGTEFEKVQINSGYRTHEEQAEIMLFDVDRNTWDTTYEKSAPLLRVLMDIYENGTIYTKEQLSALKIRENSHQDILQYAKPYDKQSIIDTLAIIIEEEKYTPSKHPLGIAYDIQKSANIDTTKYIYDNHEGGKGGQYKGHYHLTFPK